MSFDSRCISRAACAIVLFATSFLALAMERAKVHGVEPLHQRIDSLIANQAKDKTFAPVADDAQFARRIYLDLAGRIPSYAELRKFLDDKQANKRTLLIDQLLASPEYPRRMQELFSAMLLERRGDNAEWVKFLRTSFEANKPWDQLAREIVDPDPENEANRGSAFFHTKRLEKVGEQETDYPGLTRDVGRLFLGMDLQCAQCHNHLFIDNYKQQDFQGLFIAFQNTFIRNDVKFPAIGEKPITQKIDFMSVFDKVPLATGPRLPGGKEMEIPQFEKGQEYLVPPDRKKNFPGVPKFSALEALAHEMSTPQNRAFVDNIVNRLWFVMMGRGLVNPLDQLHVGNPPSHPEVMEVLGQEFVEHKFDIKWALRELALTQTYQRTSKVAPDGERPAAETYLVGGEKRLSAEQVYWSALVATGDQEWKGVEATSAKQPDAAAKAEQKEEDAGKKEESPNQGAPLDFEKMRLAFVKAFANPAQDPEIEINPSLKAALFVLNDKFVHELLAPRPGNLLDRAKKLTDSGAVAEEMYLSILSRPANDDEKKWVGEYLTKNSARRDAAIANIAWALLASTEFNVNH